MLTQERRRVILEILKEKGSVSVTELAEKLDASESTIRRDLVFLSNAGKINKVHGGAMALSQEFLYVEDNFEEKSVKNIDKKDIIARYAASQISDNDFVFIDAGSTTLLMAKYIENTKAKFVTNGIAHAVVLAKKGIEVNVIGGALKQSTEAIIGIVAAGNLQKYNFSKAFIGTNGVSEKQGFTTPDVDEAMIKAVVTERSFVSYVLCDSSKFNKVSAITFAPLNSACIICDKCSEEKIKNKAVVKEVL